MTGNHDSRAVSAEMHVVTSGILHELAPRFGRLLPEHVVADHVHRAVSDLLGSINAEALPEMASRLVTVRLEQHLTDTEQPPNDQRDRHG